MLECKKRDARKGFHSKPAGPARDGLIERLGSPSERTQKSWNGERRRKKTHEKTSIGGPASRENDEHGALAP